jgi:hypothetical protein
MTMSNTDRAAELLEQVEQGIRNEQEDCLEELRMDPSQEDQREMAEMYKADADDYRDIAILMRGGQGDDACEKWSDLDTAARDYLHDGYISDEDTDVVYAAFGYDDDN